MKLVSTNKERGLYPKYKVERIDGGTDKDTDRYFVLNLDSDPLALPSIKKYAHEAYYHGYDQLAADLWKIINELDDKTEIEKLQAERANLTERIDEIKKSLSK